MKHFFLNTFGSKKDKKKKDGESEEKDGKLKNGSGATTTATGDSSRKDGASTSVGTSDGKSSGRDGTPTSGVASTPSASDKKKGSASPSSVQPLPPPPPPPSAPVNGGNASSVPPNPALLELQHATMDDSDDGTVRGLDVFPAEQTDLSVTQIAEVFQVFHPFVDNCVSTTVKQTSLQKLRKILPAMAAADTTVTAETVEAQNFHPSFQIAPMLNHLLVQPAPLRARLCLAVFRFCGEILEELEDEMLSSGNGLFAGLQALNPNLSGGGNQGTASSVQDGSFSATVERCPNIDLAKIYHNLISKDDYLPTAEELNEILLRAQDLLRAEPNVLMIAMPAVLVGDLHGQVRDLTENVLPLGGPLVPPAVLATAAAAAPGKKAKRGAGAAAFGASSPAAGGSSIGSKVPCSPLKRGSKTSSLSSTSALAASPLSPLGVDATEPPANYLFLGDYVDRGSSGLRVIAILFTAKVLSPKTVFLIRGNHECANTNRFYGFLDECHRHYPIVHNKVTSLQMATLSPSEDDAADAGDAQKASASQLSAGPSTESASSADDMGWDMKDHPLWVVANDTFLLLPLCAALYEEVEAEEKPTEGVGAGAANAAEGKPTSPASGPAPAPKTPAEATGSKPVAAAPRKSKRSGNSSFSSNAGEVAKSPKLPARQSSALLRKSSTSFSSDPNSPSTTPASPAPLATAPRRMRRVVRVCAMHGGLSPSVDESFDGIIAINRFRAIERGALADLTWSDPTSDSTAATRGANNNSAAKLSSSPHGSPILDDETAEADAHAAGASGAPNSNQVPLSTFQAPCVFRGTAVGFTGNPRGTGHIFGEDATMDFISTNHLYFLVRAHQCVHEGFQWTHHDRLLTIFSAPNYCGMRNKGAILLLDGKGTPTVKQYLYMEDPDNSLMATASAPQPPKIFS